MFTGPQYTLTLKGNLRFPQTMPTNGELQFRLPDVLKVLPIFLHGNVAEMVGKFGGADQLRNVKRVRNAIAFPASCTSTLPTSI